MPSNAAHIGVVLYDRLDQERSVIQQYIQLDAVLGLPGNHAGSEEVGAQTVSHIAQRYGVVKTQRQRLVEAQSRRELHEVAVDIRRTPVDRKHRIQAPCFFRVSAPECLARLPIQEIVARHGCWAQGRREVSGIIGHSELIEAGISFPALDVVNGARCCVPTRGEPNLRNKDWIPAERRNQAGWVARKRRRIASHHHRSQIEMVDRYDTNFRGRGRERIGGLECRTQIAQRIAHWPVDEGLSELRVSIEILAGKLSHAYGDAIVQPSLLDPPRIEAGRIEAHQATGPGQKPQIHSEIASALRQPVAWKYNPSCPDSLPKSISTVARKRFQDANCEFC